MIQLIVRNDLQKRALSSSIILIFYVEYLMFRIVCCNFIQICFFSKVHSWIVFVFFRNFFNFQNIYRISKKLFFFMWIFFYVSKFHGTYISLTHKHTHISYLVISSVVLDFATKHEDGDRIQAVYVPTNVTFFFLTYTQSYTTVTHTHKQLYHAMHTVMLPHS